QIVRMAVAIGILLLLFRFVRHLDWHAILQATRQASVPLLILSALGNLPLIWLKAWRMRLLLGARVSTWKLMDFFVSSYAADNMVMSQAGLGIRIALIHREGVPLPTAVTTQALEKVLEAVGLAVVALPLVGTPHLVSWLRNAVTFSVVAGAI